jgi:hypothetical protein
MFPVQGAWTEDEYLALEDNAQNWMIELNDGRLERQAEGPHGTSLIHRRRTIPTDPGL